MKGAIDYVAIAKVIFSRVKITCYFHMWRYQVFAWKLTLYFIGVYIINKCFLHLFYQFKLMVGYRDAECGWVMVEEENHHHEGELPKSSLRTALFLVIYATKRGILEVFTKLSKSFTRYCIICLAQWRTKIAWKEKLRNLSGLLK